MTTAQKPRALALDLDGTLTNSRKEVTPRVRDAVRRTALAGVHVILASGRPVVGMAHVADGLGLDEVGGYVLANNGSKIIEWRSKETVFEATLPRKAVEEAEFMAGCEIRSVYAGSAGSHIKGANSHGVIAVKGGGEVGQRDVERVLDAAKAVAIPGTSEHQLGLAVDLVDANMQDLTSAQESTETQKWLMANSWRYGFIHRYPNGKTDITGIIYEPWHYRYVGKDAAQEIFNRDITLEEYLGKTEH